VHVEAGAMDRSLAHSAAFLATLLIVQAVLLPLAHACTIGVADGSVTEDDRPLLWKSRMWSGSPDNFVGHFSWGTYDYVGVGSLGGFPMMGVNEAGLCTGNTLVGDGSNSLFMNIILGSYSTVDEVRDYIQQEFNAGTLAASGCFPFLDADGNATLFEIDHANWVIEYDTLDPDRAGQDMLGWVVRANEFHQNADGTDDTWVGGRYASGVYNTDGLIDEDLLSAQTIMQGDDGASGYEFMRYGPGRSLSTIATSTVCSSMTVHGVLPDEDPALATMWAMPGQANYGISVPTWVAVSDVPDCLGDGSMAARANSLYGKGNEADTQASVLPIEAHLFEEAEALLDHWRSEGVPAVDEMTRVEHRMADDGYSLLNCLDNTEDDNAAPTVVMDEPNGAGLTLQFTATAADADGSVQSWFWEFGDDANSADPSPWHTYGAPGWYLVSCTVSDDDGVTNTDWQYLYVDYEPTTLTLEVVNPMWGSVDVDPNLPEYTDPNTVVTLTAVPIDGKTFGHWEIYDPNHPGDANYVAIDANDSIVLVMDVDREVIAVFKCGSGVGQALPLLMIGAALCRFGFRVIRRSFGRRGA